MPIDGQPKLIEEFRGLYELPLIGLEVQSPYATVANNVDFNPGRVKTRGGFSALATPVSAAKVVSIAEYVMLDNTARRTLTLSSAGEVYKETGAYSYALSASNIVQASLMAALRMNGVTLFGKFWAAFATNGKAGTAVPRVFDDTNWDRMAPAGPAAAPVVASNANAGSVEAGERKAAVFFKTRSGYWTAPGPPVTFTATSLKKLTATDIPIGPSNITGRVIAFTPVCSEDFFFIPGGLMELNDNTTTSITDIDFDDATLISGFPVSSDLEPDDDLFNQIELPVCANLGSYNGRIWAIGERANVVRIRDGGFQNLSFDGGYTPSTPTVPAGWTSETAGHSLVQATGGTGFQLRITGDGTNMRGKLRIALPGIVDKRGRDYRQAALPAGKRLGARVRVQKSASAVAGSIYLWWADSATYSTTLPTDFLEITTASMSSSEWRVIEGQLVTAALNKPTALWVLRVASGGTGLTGGAAAISNTATVDIDGIEIFEYDNATRGSLVRWSKAGSPEAFDGTRGLMMVAENDGQNIVAGFTIRGAQYFVKDRSIYETRDNETTEPADWPVSLVSDQVGTPSADGIGEGDEWVLIASRNGLHYFDGGTLVNITEEIQTTWNTINWTYGHLIDVKVDTVGKRIAVIVATGAATEADKILYCKYEGDNPLKYRNWSLHTVTGIDLICQTFSERSDGTRAWLFGTNETNGRVWGFDTSTTDATVAISSAYRTNYLGGTHGVNFGGYMTANLSGSGTLNTTLVDPAGTTLLTLPTKTLASTYAIDFEWIFGLSAERTAVNFATTSGSFALNKMAFLGKTHPWYPIRGV